MSAPRLLLALAAVAALLAPPHGEAAPGCRLARIAEWPLKPDREGFAFDGEINGKPAVFQLDVTKSTTLIGRSFLAGLGLEVRNDGSITVNGLPSGIVNIGEMRIGTMVRAGFQALAVGEVQSENRTAVILGNDFFEGIDLELDLPGGAARLFRPQGCEDTVIAYWASQGAGVVPFTSVPLHEFEVQVNGKAVLAALETVGPWSLLAQSMAKRLGVTRDTPGAAVTGCNRRFIRDGADIWVAPFETFQIGDERIRHPRLQVTDFGRGLRAPQTGSRLGRTGSDGPEMILAVDFLSTHRVLISRSQKKLYFTNAGGRVFPSIPAWGCDKGFREPMGNRAIGDLDEAIARDPGDMAARKSRAARLGGRAEYDRALADLDEALRGEPGNPSTLIGRARIHLEKGDHDRALADFDAALRLHPENALVLAWRASVHFDKRDYARAIADYGAAIERGAQVGWVHADRGIARAAGGDPKGGIADLTHAIDIDPRSARAFAARGAYWNRLGEYDKAIADHDVALAREAKNKVALRSRALAHFFLGHFGYAARDFEALMRVAPEGQSAVWRYIAFARDGKDGMAPLRAFADGHGGEAWPAPIIRYHLGQIDRDKLLESAADTDPKKRKEQECEANFQLGQHGLILGDPAAARPFLERARDACPAAFVEHRGAIADLSRLQ